MPIIVIRTNIQKSSIPDDFLKGFAETYAEALKREMYKDSVCTLHAGLDMIKNGNDEPAAYISIQFTHKLLNEDTKRTVTRKLMNYMKTQLDLNDEIMKRFVVVFEKLYNENVGNWRGLLSDFH